jgi:fructoselysine-6-P-deglycase FrlB-like protein
MLPAMTSLPAFDPDTPLPGPPEPWAATDVPSRRPGPPFHMTDMIAAEPGLARRILHGHAASGGAGARLARAIRDVAAAGGPILVTGCGTSEHAALAVVEVVREALREAGVDAAGLRSVQAFELALDPPSGGLVIGISHEGATGATNAALEAARRHGARTAIVTVSDRSPGAALADLVLTTGELDQGWCHVVGYLSPILAMAAVAAHVSGRAVDPDAAARLLRDGSLDEAAAERIAAVFADASRLVVIASGADRPAGRELVLKVEEGSWLPAAYRDLETFLHGHLPATDASTALVVVLADRAGRTERAARAVGALRAASVLGVRSAAILAAELDATVPADLTPAGRLLVAEAAELPAPVAALLGSATPLQLLAERLARARGTNPDTIRRDDPLYGSAADAAETPGA